jgi:hypothetical protein
LSLYFTNFSKGFEGPPARPFDLARCGLDIEGGTTMCRNIKTLYNFEPPVTGEEIRQASLQFVRKVSGFNHPSKANQAVFLAAVDEIASATGILLNGLKTSAPPRDRAEEAAKAHARAAQRFARWSDRPI